MKKIPIGLLALFYLAFSSTAQTTDLQRYLDLFAERSEFKHAIISAAVLDIKTGELIAGLNEDKSLVPASSLKLITTFSALHFLGPEYQYETKLLYDGKLEQDGTLKGNIYIIGSGDPSLASSKFPSQPSLTRLLAKWTKEIKDIGIICIDGEVIADESIFDSFPISPSWQWNDLGNYYASGAWGINVHDNRYFIYFQQMPKEGQTPKLMRYGPKIPGLILQNEISTGKKGTGDEAYIFGGPYDFTKRIVGTIPPGTKEFSIKGSIPDPPKFLAYHLSRYLNNKGIKNQGYKAVFKKKRRRTPVVISALSSPRVKEMVKLANLESNNLITEALLKTIGYETHKSGRAGHGIREISKWLSSKGLDMSALHMEDGSGLSARNRVSALFFAKMMQLMIEEMGIENIIKYLPKAGVSGSLRGMFAKSSARGNIWAKSGSMNGIISYTGLVQSKSGKWFSFSILINGFSKKNKEIRPRLEQFMTAIYKLG